MFEMFEINPNVGPPLPSGDGNNLHGISTPPPHIAQAASLFIC